MRKIVHLSFALVVLSALIAYSQERQLTLKDSKAGKRVALVIGNSAYETAPLKNPVNDAQDIAQSLRELGFDVTYKANLTQNDMKQAIRAFGEKLRGGGNVGLFYYCLERAIRSPNIRESASAILRYSGRQTRSAVVGLLCGWFFAFAC